MKNQSEKKMRKLEILFVSNPWYNISLLSEEATASVSEKRMKSTKIMEFLEDPLLKDNLYLFSTDIEVSEAAKILTMKIRPNLMGTFQNHPSNLAAIFFLTDSFVLNVEICKDVNFLFVFQTKRLMKDVQQIASKLPQLEELVCFISYIISLQDIPESTRMTMLSDLALVFKKIVNTEKINDQEASNVISYLEQKIEKLAKKYFIPSLMIMGILMNMNYSLSLLLSPHPCHFQMKMLFLYNSKDFLSVPPSALRTSIIGGFCIFSQACITTGKLDILEHWGRLISDQGYFIEILQAYLQMLEKGNLVLVDPAFAFFEEKIKKNYPKSSYFLDLVKFSGSLSLFVAKITEYYKEKLAEPQVDREAISKDIHKELQAYLLKSQLSYSEIYDFILLMSSGKIQEPFKTIIQGNASLLSSLHNRFEPGSSITEPDLPKISSIYSKHYDLINLSQKTIELLLFPLVNKEGITFSVLLSKAVLPLGTEALHKFLEERIKIKILHEQKQKVMKVLSDEIDKLIENPEIAKTDVAENFMYIALGMLKTKFRDYKVMIEFCASLDYFKVDSFRTRFWIWILKNVAIIELDKGNLDPISYAGDLRRQFPRNKSVENFFKDLCSHFDKNKIKTFEMNEIFAKLLDPIYTMVKLMPTAMIGNTIEIMNQFYKDLKRQDIKMRAAQSLKTLNSEQISSLVEIMQASQADKGETPNSEEIKKLFKEAYELLEKIEKESMVLKSFSTQKSLLKQEDKIKLKEMIDKFYENESSKTLNYFLTSMPDKIRFLLPPLMHYYKISNLNCSNTLLKLAFGESGIDMTEFASKYDNTISGIAKDLKKVVDSLETINMAYFEQLFGSSNNIKAEVKGLKELLGIPASAEQAWEIALPKVFMYTREKRVYKQIVEDLISLKSLFVFCGEQLYDLFSEYITMCKEKYMETNAKLFIQKTDEIKGKIQGIFGIDCVELEKILNKLACGKELLHYLKKEIKKEKLSELKQGISDYDDSHIQRGTFDIFEELQNFLETAQAIQAPKPLQQMQVDPFGPKKELIAFVFSFYSKKKNIINSILEDGKKYLEKLQSLVTSTDKISVLHMEKINEILAKSEFIIKYNPIDNWKVDIKYFSTQEKLSGVEFKYFDLQSLSERAFLHKNRLKELQVERREHETPAEVEPSKLEEFIELTKLLSNILEVLEKITELSLPDFPSSHTIQIENGNIVVLQVFYEKIKSNYEKWEESIKKAYKDFNILTYWTPSQFKILETYLIDPAKASEEIRQEAANYLRFAGIVLDVNSYIPEAKYQKPNDPEEQLCYLGEYVTKLISIDQKPLISPIASHDVYAVYTENLMEGIYNIYSDYAKELPEANQIIFCTERTKWEEVMSFAYRSLYTPTRVFTMLYPERLPYDVQKRLIRLLEKNDKEAYKVPLALVCLDKDSLIFQHFQSLGTLRCSNNKIRYPIGDIISALTAKYKESYSQVRFVTSCGAGTGKSAFIITEAKAEGLILNIVSLYGTVSVLDLGQKLDSLKEKFAKPKAAIWFKINRVTNPEILDELFFQLLIFRCLQYGGKVIYLPSLCKIFVEISNTYKEKLQQKLTMKTFFWLGKVESLGVYRYLDDVENKYLKHICNYLQLLENNSINSKVVSIKSLDTISNINCKTLMEKYCFSDSVLHQMPLLQISIFLKFLSKMLENFENSPFQPETIKQEREIYGDNPTIRQSIVTMLIDASRDLTNNSIHSKKYIELGDDMLESEVSKEYILSITESLTTYNERNRKILCFLETGQFLPLYETSIPTELTILLKSQIKSPSPSRVASITRSSFTYSSFVATTDIRDLLEINYKKMKHEGFVKLLSMLFNRPDLDPKDYVLTFDNFFKMIYIYLRAISEIPIILMGETGCGKTRLISFLCETLLGAKMHVINIHAGVSSNDIIASVEHVARQAVEEEKKKHWIFFDEFNTNQNIGLISEIICDKVLNGNFLPNNIIFIAACNPYKVRISSTLYANSAGFSKENIMTSSQKSLVYRVYQLPKTMMEYVWDFGPLKPEDEMAYIWAILGPDEKFAGITKAKVADLIVASHNFFRKEDEEHIVSLRDLRRYLMLYEWFKKTKKDNEKAAILALVFCYYYRISFATKRDQYLEKISNRLYGSSTQDKIKDLIKEEADFYISHFSQDEQIVQNDSITECILAMIVCILTRIPLLVIGKPGCSKTLALRFLQKQFKGSHSSDPFFKNYPEIVLFTFQGSLTCESSGIEKVFERAKNAGKTNPAIIPVVVIEEIGLCELSPHNPLKVLHKRLELDSSLDIGFLGLSNWRLDAAKMNRALYLARLPPSLDELEKTANEIYRFYDKLRNEPLMKDVAAAYESFQKQFADMCENAVGADIYGLRDYYALLNQISIETSVETDMITKYTTIRNCMKRCFDTSPLKRKPVSLWRMFLHVTKQGGSKLGPKKSKLARISDSIRLPGRYLMLIGRSLSYSLLTTILFKEETANMKPIIGSEYEKDINSKEYTSKLLCQIVFCVERGIPLIFMNLKGLYSHLYDLFNQYKGNKACRIPIGSAFHPVCKIDYSFFCIVCMSETEFYNEQPPLLNRFEKHYLTLDMALNENERRCFNILSSWLDDFMTPSSKLTLQHIFANLDDKKDFLRLLIIMESRKLYAKENEIANKCKITLLELATMDLLVQVSLSKHSEEEKGKIVSLYRSLHEVPLKHELVECTTVLHSQRFLYFTYSEKNVEHFKNKVFEGCAEKVMVMAISQLKSEESLYKQVETFFMSKEHRLLLVAVDLASEFKHIDHLYATILKNQEDDKARDKNVCILVFMKRTEKMETREFLCLEGYKMKMHDSIEQNTDETDKIINQLNEEIKSIILEEIKTSWDDNFNSWLSRACIKISRDYLYIGCDSNRSEYSEERNSESISDFLMKRIPKDPILMQALRRRVEDAISAMKSDNEDLKNRLSGSEALKYRNIQTAAQKMSQEKIESFVAIIIYTIEKYSAFRSYFTEGIEPSLVADIKEMWMRTFKKLNLDWKMPLNEVKQGKKIPYYKGLNFPFSYNIYDLCQKCYTKDDIKSVKKIDKEQEVVGILKDYLNEAQEKNFSLLMLLFEDFLTIFCKKNFLSASSMTIMKTKQLIIDSEADFSGNFVKYLEFIFLKQGMLRGLLNLMQIASNFTTAKIVKERVLVFSDSIAKGATKAIDAKIKMRIIELLDRLLPDILPTKELILRGPKNVSCGRYTGLLMKIYITCFIFIDGPRDIVYWDMLLFWLEFSKFITRAEESPEQLINFSQKLANMASKEKSQYPLLAALRGDNFLTIVLDYINHMQLNPAQKNATCRFKTTLYRIMLNSENSSNALKLILNEFNDPDNCKFFVRIIPDISAKCDITNQMSKRKGVNIELTMNLHMKELDKFLGEKKITCNFGVMFYYFLWKRYNDEIRKVVGRQQKFEESFKYYLTTATGTDEELNTVTAKNLTRLIACIYLRAYIEVYESFCVKVDDPQYKNLYNIFTSTGLKSSNPVAATLVLYLLKRTRDEPGNMKKLTVQLRKEICIESLGLSPPEEILTTKQYLPAILTDQSHMKLYLDLVTLMRHLKTVCLTHDDQALETFYNRVSDYSDLKYSGLLTMSLNFVNELFILKMTPKSPTQFDLCEHFKEKFTREHLGTKIENKVGDNLYDFYLELLTNYHDQWKLLSYNFLPDGLPKIMPMLPIIISFAISIFLSGGSFHTSPFIAPFYEKGKLTTGATKKIMSSFLYGMRYAIEKKKGYVIHAHEGSKKEESGASGLSNRVLHFILHSLLYYLYKKNKIESIFGAQNNVEDYMIEHIRFDIDYISNILQWSDTPRKVMIWLGGVLAEFSTILPETASHSSNGTTEEDRNEFEKFFEDKIIAQALKEKDYWIQKYENAYRYLISSPLYITGTQLLTEQKKDNYYKYIELFKILEQPSLDNVQKCYKEVRDIFPLFSIITDNKESDISRLNSILPIVKLTNFILETYNYRITKEKAKEMALDTIRYPALGNLLNDFKDAWVAAKFPIDLTYMSSKVRNNPKLGQTPFLRDYILDDTEESGKLLIAGITELCHIQNSVLGFFTAQLETNIIGIGDDSNERVVDKRVYPVQSLMAQDIISFNAKFSIILSNFAYYSNDYLSNTGIYYDYEGIEQWLIFNLLDKKIIDVNKVDKICYQGSVLGEHTLLDLMKEKVQLCELDGSEAVLVRDFCKRLTADRGYEQIKEVMNTLESVMYFIQDSTIPPQPDITVKEYAQHKFGSDSPVLIVLETYQDIASIHVNKIVDIYEKIEIHCFDFLSEFLPSELKTVQLDLDSLLGSFVTKLNECDLLEDFNTALKRFILRGLTTIPEKGLKLYDYIFSKSLWTNSRKINDVIEEFPKEIPADNALGVAKIIQYNINKKEGKDSFYRKRSSFSSKENLNNSGAAGVGSSGRSHSGSESGKEEENIFDKFK